MTLYNYEKEHVQALRKYLPECMVLLKSDGTFPLAEAGEIATYGSGVRNTVKGGTGSGEVNSRYYINVEQGLKDAGFTITTNTWLDAYENERVKGKEAWTKALKAEAKAAKQNFMIYAMGAVCPEPEYDLPLDGKGDVAVYVVSRISGEGNDRKSIKGDFLLSDTETRDILACNEKYDKFMLVLNVGGPVDLSSVKDVKNILVMSQLGVEAGAGLADLLLGKTYPSGKLTTTWSAAGDYCQDGEFADRDDTRYNEGIYVGYRYFDTVGTKALFPFGFGLGYTSFAGAANAVAVEGEIVTVTTVVTNTGDMAGKEVVQVYLSSPDGKLDKPYQELAAFAKTAELKPGSSETVELSFKLSDMASYDEESESYVLEAGKYIVRVGNSSVNTDVAAVLELDETVKTFKVKNVLGKPDFADIKYNDRKPAAEVGDDIPVIAVKASDIPVAEAVYDKEIEIAPEITALSDDQLLYMNIGDFDPNNKSMAAVIGSAASHVAGAAGETTNMMSKQGIPSLIMADGPAGLRIAKEYVLRDGKALAVGSAAVPESIAEMMPKILQILMNFTQTKPKKGEKILEQYCTAIPIGTAIAQSFNTAIAEDMGDIVGDEMERFGVHLWLAPALNIHRSVLCGRNFEYYSEDPLVAGKFASAITRGVQKHPGCGTTIKHYSANNQETNRYCNNSLVSERAMREIYLKGFGICVKESQPHALMTSYNLINGTHTSELRGQNEDILRSEFGYEGIVMTDWVTGGGMLGAGSKHRFPDPALVAASGNDLFMPGGKTDFDQMKKGLEEGRVTRHQLEVNATRVYNMAKKLNAELLRKPVE